MAMFSLETLFNPFNKYFRKQYVGKHALCCENQREPHRYRAKKLLEEQYEKINS